jgi:YegS/Rv2252/BmrU family lipid kinase
VSSQRTRAAVIINPVSGRRGRRDDAAACAAQAAALAGRVGVDADVFVTERAGHAHDLARAAVARGATLVVAWGGDGTVNEVGSAVAFGPACLAIVPGGSGNGLARELGVPLDAAAALAVAYGGRDRIIDAGELDGRLFFNVAGIGLDADVAHRFARGSGGRGLRRYAIATGAALLSYRPLAVTVVAGGVARPARPLVVAVANSRQYGNNACIAPAARLDDGLLDVTVVEARSAWRTLWALPSLFTGRIADVPGVDMTATTTVELLSDAPLAYHVDGEPGAGSGRLPGRVRPGALRVRAPREWRSSGE